MTVKEAAGVRGNSSGTGLVAVSKLQATLAAAVVLALGGTLVWQVRENGARRETTARQATAAGSRAMALRQEFAALRERMASVEADAAKLEAALRAASTAAAPPPRPITDDRARLAAAQQRGNQLVRESNPQAALDVCRLLSRAQCPRRRRAPDPDECDQESQPHLSVRADRAPRVTQCRGATSDGESRRQGRHLRGGPAQRAARAE